MEALNLLEHGQSQFLEGDSNSLYLINIMHLYTLQCHGKGLRVIYLPDGY